MRDFGLIGFPLDHSFSPSYFTEKFRRDNISDAAYHLYPLSTIAQLPSLIEGTPSLLGLNVTVPYKEAVLKYVNETDETVREIGAANVLRIDRDGPGIRVSAFNTDVIGFRKSIEPLLRNWHHQALILGSGGSAKSVRYVLEKIGIACSIVSREKNADYSYDQLDQKIITEHTLIINASPVGMYPDISAKPRIPYEYVSFTHLCFDLVYNPHETEFLRLSKEKGAATKNGLEMLEIQAEESWRIWNA